MNWSRLLGKLFAMWLMAGFFLGGALSLALLPFSALRGVVVAVWLVWLVVAALGIGVTCVVVIWQD